MNKEGSFKPLILVMIFSLCIAAFWESVPILKNSVHFILNPTAGFLLNYNLSIGMAIILSVLMTEQCGIIIL